MLSPALARKSARRLRSIRTCRPFHSPDRAKSAALWAKQRRRIFKPCSLEMGGKNAIIILDDANLDLALEGVLWGAFGTTGQRCTAASRVIVQKGVYRQFADRLIYRAQRLKVGNGLDESVEVGPQINEQQVATTEKYVQIGKNEGAKLEAGGKALNTPDHAYGWFFEPTIFTDVNEKMRIAQEEIFGPVLQPDPG